MHFVLLPATLVKASVFVVKYALSISLIVFYLAYVLRTNIIFDNSYLFLDFVGLERTRLFANFLDS